jgi:hypothetical protein
VATGDEIVGPPMLLDLVMTLKGCLCKRLRLQNARRGVANVVLATL